ncbi:MAG: 23S rRNA (adenine(2503)-C(2))-methyltransferase RlmN, partial [Paramuribaculum sp.]|nr:23S rRNA (adenine(2503)-C(2))-methyltransferase RlmN [Paramuribaculum sp.]
MEESKKTPLAGMTLADLKQVALECGLRSFAAGQIARWLYEKRVDSIDAMTDLPKAGRERLAKSYTVGRRKPVATQRSADGTVKY